MDDDAVNATLLSTGSDELAKRLHKELLNFIILGAAWHEYRFDVEWLIGANPVDCHICSCLWIGFSSQLGIT